jgi:fatty acid amide hydrolase
MTEAADDYRERFWSALDSAFDGGPVEAILSPPHALPALRHKTALPLLTAASHCFLANVLDAPSGVAPMDRVTGDEAAEELASRRGRSLYERLCRSNAQGSAGLPVGVQVTARPWRDDIVLAVMDAVHGASGA